MACFSIIRHGGGGSSEIFLQYRDISLYYIVLSVVHVTQTTPAPAPSDPPREPPRDPPYDPPHF